MLDKYWLLRIVRKQCKRIDSDVEQLQNNIRLFFSYYKLNSYSKFFFSNQINILNIIIYYFRIEIIKHVGKIKFSIIRIHYR